MTPAQQTPPELDERIAHLEEELEHEHEQNESRSIALWAAIAVMVAAMIITAIALAVGGTKSDNPRPTISQPAAPAVSSDTQTSGASTDMATQAHPTATVKNVEAFKPVDPTLPAVPAGAVKNFTVDVMQHVTRVAKDKPPVEAWTYTVNGKEYRGTAASTPIVVNQGDKVHIKFVNGGTKAMKVDMAHSIDFHSAEVAPSKYYVDVAPGKSIDIDFVAKHPGVYMYHCATQPVLQHVGAGMAGMMVVKPKGLAPVDKELWITQGEYYLGAPGAPTDMTKLANETPDVIAFNGYANQYKIAPITVRKGERIRMYVLDTGPSKWSAFHVIGTVFDKAVVENTVVHDSQTINLAPSQGGWVEFTLDQEGNYPFVTHSFGDMAKGAAGMLHTTGAPEPKAG